jgi:enoyl-CoA hydratase
MSDPDVQVEWLDDGAIFTIDRPGKLNALTKPVLEALSACLDQMERERRRLLIITGSGDRAFCAGTDLGELQDMSIESRLAKSEMARGLLVRLSRSPIISVAAVNGLALGGGLEVAMACTLRLAVSHATFGLPEIKLELLPAYAGTQFLPALIGPSRAQEMMLTGRTLALDEALRIGLVHRQAPEDTPLVEAALAFGREVTVHSAAVVAAIRDCVDTAGPTVSGVGLAVEDERVREIFASAAAEAGVAVFLAKRNRTP